jgi:ATP-binding cassette subfamily F protein 3
VDRFWIVADGGVQEFDGDLEDYRDWLAQHQSNARKLELAERSSGVASTAHEISTAPSLEITGIDRKQQKREEAQERQRTAILRKPIEAKLLKIENELESVQNKIKVLDTLIADAGLYSESRRQERLQTLTQHGELTKKYSELEHAWLELQSELESISAS